MSKAYTQIKYSIYLKTSVTFTATYIHRALSTVLSAKKHPIKQLTGCCTAAPKQQQHVPFGRTD